MNIAMLEPLGVDEGQITDLARPLTDAGHSFVFCGQPLSLEEKKGRVKDADILIIANSPLTSEVLRCGEHLKMITVGFTGVDHIDMDWCREHEITVCNSQGYATDSTGELAIALMLSCLRNLPVYNQSVRQGGKLIPGSQNTLRGKTVGIIGTGSIGRKVASLAKAFGCRIIGYSRSRSPEALALGLEYAELDEVFSQSDIVTLHAPLTDATKNIASKVRIDSMKETAILINCSRGPLVDSQALADALNEGRIAGAGIDVFETEPPISPEHPLLHAKNTVLTPHVGYYSQESMAARAKLVFENITSWLDGTPINVM